MKSLRVPFLLFAVPAAIVAAVPGWGEALLLRPDALAHGELWRLWSGHWVHFSASHLAWNLAVLLIVGWRLEALQPGLLLRSTLLAAPVISATTMLVEPSMEAYGGLSGVAAGLVMLLGIQLIRTRADRPLGLVFLAVLGVKILTDALVPLPLFARFDTASVHPSSTAHVAGAVCAIIHAWWLAIAPKSSSACNPAQTLRSPS